MWHNMMYLRKDISFIKIQQPTNATGGAKEINLHTRR